MITTVEVLQNGATADGNGSVTDLGGYSTAIVEIVNVGSGTATVTFQGAFDGGTANWYAVGYQKVNASATVTRAVAGITVAANSQNVYQILDFYPKLRAVQSSTSGTVAMTVRVYRDA